MRSPPKRSAGRTSWCCAESSSSCRSTGISEHPSSALVRVLRPHQGVAQLVACLAWDEEVAGSRPATLTILPRWCPPRGLPSGRSGSTGVSKTLGDGSIPSRGASSNCLSGVSGLRACLKSRRLPFDSAGRHQNNRAVAERSKASVCKTEGNSPRRFESVLHVQTEQWCS